MARTPDEVLMSKSLTTLNYVFNGWLVNIQYIWALVCYFRGHESHALFWAVLCVASTVMTRLSATHRVMLEQLPPTEARDAS